LIDATALCIGCIIGVGIFRAAASVAVYLHTPALFMLVWVLGGAISFCGALCYAELGAAYPKTGGDYVYITKAYGDAAGFLFGWTKLFIERIGTIAILGFVFAEYVGFLFPLGSSGTKWMATLSILVLTGANVVGIQVGKEVQNFLTALKVFSLAAIIGIGFGMGNPQAANSFSSWVPQDGQTLRGLGVALAFVLWAYGGWTESAYVAEEIRNPKRNLPWSIFLGLGLVTALYLAVNWVYLRFIPLDQMPSERMVAAEVMGRVLGPWGGKATALAVAISAFGALNGYILTGGRILLAIGEDHPLFGRLGRVHPTFATPAAALFFNAAGAILLVWMGTFDQIVTYSTVAISIFFAMAAFGVILLRLREPQVVRPYRALGYPLTPILFVLAMALFIADVAWMQPKETLFGFGLLALGVPLYLWSRALEKV
jgi:amino acid transporter